MLENPYEAPQSELRTSDDVLPGSAAFVRTLIMQVMVSLTALRAVLLHWANDTQPKVEDANVVTGIIIFITVIALVEAFNRRKSRWVVFQALFLTGLVTYLLVLNLFSP